MSPQLYGIYEDEALVGVYAKGNPTKEEIIEAIEYEFPWFIEDVNFDGHEIEDLKCVPVYVRMIPAPIDWNMAYFYKETEKGRGAMKAIRFATWDIEIALPKDEKE